MIFGILRTFCCNRARFVIKLKIIMKRKLPTDGVFLRPQFSTITRITGDLFRRFIPSDPNVKQEFIRHVSLLCHPSESRYRQNWASVFYAMLEKTRHDECGTNIHPGWATRDLLGAVRDGDPEGSRPPREATFCTREVLGRTKSLTEEVVSTINPKPVVKMRGLCEIATIEVGIVYQNSD